MRIVVVLEDLQDNGANRVSLDRAGRWAASGDHVTIFVTGHEDGKIGLEPPASCHVQRATSRPRRLREALPRALWTLTCLARDCDLLVAGTEVGFGLLLAWVAARLTRRPVAVSVQSRVDLAIAQHVDPWLRPLNRAVLSHVDSAVCVSNGLVPGLLQLGLPSRAIAVVPNAVSQVEVRRAATLHPDDPPDGSCQLIVSSGRLTYQKGFDLLIRGHALALRRGAPRHRLVVLGEGDQREALLRLAHDLGVEDSVQFSGFSQNPHALVSRASLYVSSSRWEGFSLALAEALAIGTACLAFDCVAGPSEVLAGGVHGGLVEAGDVSGLASGIRAHLDDPVLLTSKARRAAQTPLPLFDPERSASAHRAVLDTLVRR